MAAEANEAAREDVGALREAIAQLQDELTQFRADFEAERSEGFWHKLFGLQRQTSEDMERARERTRARIAYTLIGALVIVVAATFWYITRLSPDGLATEDIINVMQSLGTTLLAPLVGLIGAVIGFYYGGQTAVQGAQTATQAATQATEAVSVASEKPARAATQAAQGVTEAATRAATQAATQAVTEASPQGRPEER